MSLKISRRDFLKAASSWSLVGMSYMIGSQLLSSCSFSAKNSQLVQPKGHFFYAQKSLGYYFFIIQQEAMRRATEARGYDFTVAVSNLNPEVQARQMREAIPKKPVAILCDPVSSEQNFTPIIESMKNHHIPLAIVDTPGVQGDVAITVTFDNYKGGQMAAKKIISLLIEKYGKPKGIVLNCYGDLNSQAWRLRKDGFEDVIKKYENVKLISKETVGDLTKVYDATYSTLQSTPNLDAVHAPSDTPARGIYEALKASNKLHPTGDPKHVIFVTIDGEPIALQWIKEKILDASISQDPIAYSEICVEMLDMYIFREKPIPDTDYRNEKYYWRKAEMKMMSNGPNLIIPPYEINHKNMNDRRHWANVANKDWGINYL